MSEICESIIEKKTFQYTWKITNWSLITSGGSVIVSDIYWTCGNVETKWSLSLKKSVSTRISVNVDLGIGHANSVFQISLLGAKNNEVQYRYVAEMYRNNNRTRTQIFEIQQCDIDKILSEDAVKFIFDIQERGQYYNVKLKPIPIVCNLAKDLSKMLSSGEFSDVTLVAQDGSEFKAHKFILCGRSDVFAAMFRNEFLESKTNRVSIDDMDAEVMQEMLKHVYTGSGIPTHMAPKLAVVANKYALLDLKNMCESVLNETMNAATAVDTLLLAKGYYMKRLEKNAFDFIVNHFTAVAETPNWKNLKSTDKGLYFEILENAMGRRF